MRSATRKQGKQIQTVYTPNRQVKTARSEILSFNKEERSSIPGCKLFPLTSRKHFPQGYKLGKFQRELFCAVYQASPSLENEKKNKTKQNNKYHKKMSVYKVQTKSMSHIFNVV